MHILPAAPPGTTDQVSPTRAADPLSGVTRLETGLREDGTPSSGLLRGMNSHSDVFNVGTTAFNNILGVMTGGEVSLYVDAYEYAGQVPASEGPAYLNPMENPDYQPPTMDVP